MNRLINAAIARARPVLLVLALILVAGAVATQTIPKEAAPDIAIPVIYVSIPHDGISPEDAERLLVRPMEKELRSIEGLKELRAKAAQGSANMILEFEAGFDSEKALTDVREKVDTAKAELPADTSEPTISEVNVALFPILVVTLYGDAPERMLVAKARDLRDKLEALPSVQEVDIAGDRQDLLEVIIDPTRLEGYSITIDDVFQFVSRNNQLVAAGALDTGHGRFAVKLPGVFENVNDVLDMPVKVSGDKVVTFRDVASVRRTFKDPDGYARVNGKPAVALEISKRIGTNIIDTVAEVRALVDQESAAWPDSIHVGYSQDASEHVRSMLSDLQNNVLAAVLLVMIVVIAALGLRAAGLVGMAIPGSFFAGILVLAVAGLTVNIVVLFSLIMAVGMLVDGAIVVVELADRKMAEGLSRREAYAIAAARMAWPIIAATATTLAAFLPLLFWPGVVGEIMKFLPITLIATLSASLLMALVFVPTLGALIGRRAPDAARYTRTLVAAETGNLDQIEGLTGAYIRALRWFLKHPGKVVLAAVALLAGVYTFYAHFGRGVEFFPKVEPENAVLQVHARGDLSVRERDALVRSIESRILDMNEFGVYARSGTRFRAEVNEDVVGLIQLEFTDWKQRRPAGEILAEIRQRTADLAGVVIEIQKEKAGPPVGKAIQIQLSARDAELLPGAIAQVRELLRDIDGLVDITDSRPVPGIEWQLQVDRAEASRFGADIATVGNAIQLVTNGVKLAEYRPDDTDEEVDIRVRFPDYDRSIDQLDRLRVPTRDGVVPISNFVSRAAAPKVGVLDRSDGRRVMKVEAELIEGVLADDKVRQIRQRLQEQPLDPRIDISFKGEDEEQRAAGAFLIKALGVALFVMAIILVTQFNSFYQALLILSAVVFSTIGVLLGLLVTHQPFGIVMSGIGVIALAGIVVNNNIVLIDTFNLLRRQGMGAKEAVLRTGAQRLRPVLLTTVTTIFGLMPMVLGINIDLIGRSIAVGGPSTQWWIQLATAVAGGLAFATLLTLLLTPCLLLLGERLPRAREAKLEAPAAGTTG
ncbi:MAG: efflux RND transporter permease subunit [Acidiferrobacterales bacterium]